MNKLKNIYLSKGGKLLIVNNENNFFMTASGEFIRLVSNSEKNALAAVMAEISFLKNPIKLPEVSNWKFLWSVTKINNRGYVPDTKAGHYGYTNTVHYFVRSKNGEIEFTKLNCHSTTADMHYTDNGQFRNVDACTDVILFNIDDEEKRSFNCDLKYRNWQEMPLETFSQTTTIDEAANAVNAKISSDYKDDDTCASFGTKAQYKKDDLSLEEKLARHKKIHELTKISL